MGTAQELTGNENGPPGKGSPRNADPHPAAWPALRRSDLFAIIGLLVLVAVLTIPRLPPGICFDDAGDLQLASATLGIEHPPGYAGYTTIGYLITRFSTVDPAYVVSLACLACGLIALLGCVLIQIRLGADAWFACAIAALLVWHPRFWLNLRSPEVYMPTLAFTVVSAYLLLRYARVGRRRDLYLAALAFGVALGNRPPVLFVVPFFVIGWWFARQRWETTWRQGVASLSLVAALALLPCVYSLVYIIVRDRPQACYNYIDDHNEVNHVLPESTDGLSAKLQRAYWHLSGQQFRVYMGDDWRGVVGKWRWIRSQLNYGGPVTDAVVFVYVTLGLEPPAGQWFASADVIMLVLLAAIGLYVAFRRCRVSAWLLTGLIVHCLAFVSVYRVHGQAADLLPFVFAGAVLMGVAGSTLFPMNGSIRRRAVACLLAVLTFALLVRDLPRRASGASGADAAPFVEAVDLATFPQQAVIIANWTKSVPLRYAQCVLHHRTDLHIITADPVAWIQLARKFPDRPIYVASALEPLGPCTREPFRNIFRLECPHGEDAPHDDDAPPVHPGGGILELQR